MPMASDKLSARGSLVVSTWGDSELQYFTMFHKIFISLLQTCCIYFFYSTEIENVWTSTSLLFSLSFRAPPSCFKRRCKSSTWSNAEILPVHRSTEIRSQRSQNNLEPVRTEHSTATEVKLPPCCGELWAVAPRAKRAQRHVACVSHKMHVCSPNIITLWPDRLQEIVFITAKYITWPSKARDELCPSKREPSNIHEAKYQSQSQPGSPPLPEVSQDAAGPEKDKKRLKLLSFKNLGFPSFLWILDVPDHGDIGSACVVSSLAPCWYQGPEPPFDPLLWLPPRDDAEDMENTNERSTEALRVSWCSKSWRRYQV